MKFQAAKTWWHDPGLAIRWDKADRLHRQYGAAGTDPKERDPMQDETVAAPLHTGDLHGSLEDPALESMNFLNEIGLHYPDAISFASGRPFEEFFDVDLIHRYLDLFCGYLKDQLGYDDEQARRVLFPYGRTKGIVHELIARQLAVDEGIEADPESIVVTVGCQEAMFLVARALRRDDRDVLFAVAPTYVGLTAAARLADLPA